MAFPKFKKKDEIPKGFESEYEEKDGEWIAKVPDTSTLEGTLATVREEKKTAERAQKEAEKKLGETQRKLEAKEAVTGDFDKKSAELLDKWNVEKDKAVKAVQDQLDTANGELRTIKLDDKAKDAFIKAGGRPEKAASALSLAKPRLDLIDNKLVVKDADGKVSATKIEDYWGTEFKKQEPEYYTGTKATGGGAKGGASTAPASGSADAAERVIRDPLAMLNEANAALATAGK